VAVKESNPPKQTTSRTPIYLVEDETQTVLDWAAAVMQSDDTYFQRGQRLARRLGAHIAAMG
jgi:hypothetical protein